MDIRAYDGFALDMTDASGEHFPDPLVLALAIQSGAVSQIVNSATEVSIKVGDQTYRVFGQNLDGSGPVQINSLVWMQGDQVALVFTQMNATFLDLVNLILDAVIGDFTMDATPWDGFLYGEDTITGANRDDVLVGYEGSDKLYGGAGRDVLYGDFKVAPPPDPFFPLPIRWGDDWLDGGEGADDLFGGKGDDTYVVDNVGDRIAEGKNDGHDTVRSSIGWSLAGMYVEDLILTGAAHVNGAGNSLDNVLTGNDGINVLSGMGGDDVYWIQNSGDRVIEAKSEGFDVVHSTASYSLASQYVEDLWLEGAADINATGNSLNNYLRGNAGVNILAGGKGDDRYFVQTLGDRVIEASGEGIDEVFSMISFGLAGQHIEKLTLAGSENLNATGNGLNNTLTGNDGKNVLRGGDGHDVYVIQTIGDKVIEAEGARAGHDHVFSSVSFSLAGQYIEDLTLFGFGDLNATGNSLNNTLTGNIGKNVLTGGKGNDTFIVQTAGDRVVELDGQGDDHVVSFISFSLAGQYVERLTLTGSADITASGNSLDNIIVGNDGDNAILGSGGADTMFGGDGVDTFAFLSRTDSTLGASDRILDLEARDIVDLSKLDANTGARGDQAFQLVDSLSSATANGSGRAVLGFDAAANQTILLLDVNLDGKADFRLIMDGDHRDHGGWAW